MSHPTQSSDHPALNQRYTFEEFLTAFDGYHAEWLPDGSVERITTNAISLLDVKAFLIDVLKDLIELSDLKAIVLSFFVQRLSPESSAREPDILVVLNEHLDRLKPTYLDGAADIVIEVVSPESIERDYGVKFREYEQGGVREYWLIDPERRIADVYELGENALYRRRPLDGGGRITSGLLSKFALSPDVLWSEVKPDPIATLKLVAALVGVNLRDLM